MKTNNFLTLLFSAIFILGYTSCGNNEIPFSESSVNKVLKVNNPYCDTIKNYCTVNFLLQTPIAESNSALNAIQQNILLYALGDSAYMQIEPQKALENFTSTIFANYYSDIRDIYKKLEGKAMPMDILNNEFSIESDILFNDNNILSYEIDRYSYTGGAHGSNITQYLVFDTKTGNRITEHDIFEEGFEPRLTDLLIHQHMKDKGFEAEEQMLQNGYFALENLTANNNFSIDENGITYIFNEYEIACYANGESIITIPFDSLKTVLKPESPISYLLKK